MLITDIKYLIQVENEYNAQGKVYGEQMSTLPIIENAWLLINDGIIADYGSMDNVPSYEGKSISLQGRSSIMPTWCDSHTHLVFAAPRESEFVDKIKGATYAEIAAKGGGILNSAKRLGQMSEDDLFDLAKARLQQVIQLGTGAIEIKSGYGLDKENELKMLRVIQRLKALQWIPIKSTFLAAHALPESFKDDKSGYVDMMIDEVLPIVVNEKLADYIDVFCEKGFFDEQDTSRIIKAGRKFGLKAKIHANQLNLSGGVQVGVDHEALSVDHLETMSSVEVDYLKGSNTIPTLLPGAAFFLRMSYPPARELINAGLPVTIASDFNPGSCPSGNMNVLMSLSCIQMKMTPEEVINAQTINGAAAMELSNEVGSIAKGKKANFIVLNDIPSIAYLPYAYGYNHIESVYVNGEKFTK